MQCYDPVLIHQAPRRNTNMKQGGPVGPYAFPANKPRDELPDRPARPNEDIKCASEDDIRQHDTVNGKNLAWITVPVLFNSIKRIIHNERKQSFWETDHMKHLLDCLFDAYLKMNDSVPKLSKYKW